MCKGKKACKACSLNIGRTMARKSKSVNITMEDVVFAGLGAIAGLAVNPLANKALENQSEQVRNTVGTALPLVKVAGGGYLVTNRKMDRRLRMGGLGLAAEGSIELGLRYLPGNYVSIQGVNGDVFSMLGSTTVEIPVTPSASLPAGGLGFEQEAILGTADVYSAVASEMAVL